METQPKQAKVDEAWRWRKTLAFRLSLAINLTAVAVLGVFWFVDYRRERSVHLDAASARLLEEAKVLRAAQSYLKDPAEFQQFIDTFCHQMSVAASPGHHVAVFAADGTVQARANVHPDPALESRMASGRERQTHRFEFREQPFVSVSVNDGESGRIVVTQSLAPLQRLIRAQGISRAASLAALALLIFAVTSFALVGWVAAPLRKLVGSVERVGRGDFATRIQPSGSAEFRSLARGLNEMTAALERVEKGRQSEMRRARAIQRRLLPAVPIRSGAIEIVAAFEPTESVGGDLFDVIELPDGSLLLAVWDVSGHGVPGALYTALLRTVLHQQAGLTTDLRAILGAMNREFISVAGNSGQFATCLLMHLHADGSAADYAGAGHDAAVLVHADRSVEELAGRGLPIGVETDCAVEVARAGLRAGDRVFLLTDGLHEVSNAGGELFGRERLAKLLVETIAQPPAEQVGAVVERVRAFAGDSRFADDVTLVCAARRA